MIVDIGRHVSQGGEPRISFSQIAAPCRIAPPAPLFLLGPSNAVIHEEIFGQAELGEVGTYAIDGATVAPTGIALKDGLAFSSGAFIHPLHHVETVVSRLHATDLPVRRIDGPLAVIYGPGHQTYGHWLVDFLPRLWVLAQCGHDLRALRYVAPPDLGPVARDLLARVGIRASQLVTYRYWREVLQAERLLMPTGLRTHNRMSPHFRAATAFWTRRLRKPVRSVPSRSGSRLFLSRADVAGERVLQNRAQIEAIALHRGYALVHPQRLPLAEQATLFAGARIVAGEYGSALHGTVYSAPGTLTIGLRGTARHPSFVQSGVAGALGQLAGYVLGATSLDGSGSEVAQSFAVAAEDFERALDIAEIADIATGSPQG